MDARHRSLLSRVQVKEGNNNDDMKLRSESPPVRHLNATFSDLPAPHWEWEEMPPAPVPRLDGASVQIGDLLYVVAGYESLDHVSNSTHSLRADCRVVASLFLHLSFLV